MRLTRLPYRVDALDGLVRLQEALESAFDRPWGFEPGSRQPVYPPMEVSSDEDGYAIRLEVPGIAPENLTVEIHGQVLNLAGKREAQVPVAGGRQEALHRKEPSTRTGPRDPSFTLTESIRFAYGTPNRRSARIGVRRRLTRRRGSTPREAARLGPVRGENAEKPR